MSDGEALLRTILERPDEDTARLVYADWLQEHGQGERAWLIRFQCDHANRYIHDGTDEFPLIEKRAADWFHLRELTGRKYNRISHHYYAADWGWPLLRIAPPRLRGDWYELSIRRGFVYEISLPSAAFVRHAETLFASHPIEHVVLSDAAPLHFSGSYWWTPETPGGRISYEVVESIIRDGARLSTSQAAHAWLSARCVAYGRSLAGLSACRVNSDHAAQTE